MEWLRRCGKALYGEESWVRPTARLIDVDYHKLRRWNNESEECVLDMLSLATIRSEMIKRTLEFHSLLQSFKECERQ